MTDHDLDIAVIAMEGRFPGADSVAELWDALLNETDLVSSATPEAFLAAGGDPALLDDPDLVLDRAVLKDIASFDHRYFGLTRAEAELLDPQHRVFLQVAVHAFERAGLDPSRSRHLIGVHVGSGQGHYERKVLPPHGRAPESLESFNTAISNLVSSLPTRLAYCLDLRGPAISVQTACSTSLVAIHMACQDLLSLRCDVALAGGVTLDPTPDLGQLASLGGLLSPDGRCRPFSADANGIGSGDAAAAVILKRYADAVADGDHIHAVIRSTAINNDGRDKVGFTAPSVSGQARVIREALELAMIEPHQIGYVEAHGTGTPTGDPIEIAALARAFGPLPAGSCRIGSIKSNLGHTDTASGVVSFIKAVLCVEHGVIPATLHFNRPNPEIDFGSNGFRVVSHTEPWSEDDGPRRAGVSSFGIGGTNAHVILEQHQATADRTETGEPPTTPVVTLSAASREALSRSAERLRRWLMDHPEADLSDVAATLHSRPKHGRFRGAVVATDPAETLVGLKDLADGRVPTAQHHRDGMTWFFPGGGTLHPGCTQTLDTSPAFAEAWRQASRWADEHGVDLDDVMGRGPRDNVESSLGGLAVQYGLIEHLRTVLPSPTAVIGHSLGEYAAAIAAGVLTLADAMTLALARGRVLDDAGGLTLLVGGGVTDIEPTLIGELGIAADNGPHACLVSGPTDDVMEWHRRYEDDWLIRRVDIPVAAHHALLDAHLHHMTRALSSVTLSEPTGARFISTPLGREVTTELGDASYWVDQVRAPVRFAAAVHCLGVQVGTALEVGAGQSLTALAPALGLTIIPTMPRRSDSTPALEVLTRSFASLWEAGVEVRWPTAHRVPLPLPLYPFETARCWPRPTSDPVLVLDGLDSGFETARRVAEAGGPLLVATTSPPAAASLPDGDTPTVEDPEPDVRRRDEALDVFAAAHVAEALRAGLRSPREPLSTDDLLARLSVQPIHHRLLRALLRFLNSQGLLEHHDAGFVIRPSEGLPEATDQATRLITRCASNLVPVLSGQRSGVEALLSDDIQHTAEDERSLHGLKAIRETVTTVVRDLASRTGGAPLRVLEVGAGRGMIFWPMVEALHDEPGLEFTFTDVGRSFVLDARQRAADHCFDRVRCSVLDVSRPVDEQGFASGTHDVVVAFNCLHAVPNARDGIRACRDLLADGGTLLLIELHSLPNHGILTAGFHTGMWHFTDDRDDELPLLSPRQWSTLLADDGFTGIRTSYINAHHAVMMATRGSSTATQRLHELRSHTRVTVASWQELAGSTWQRSTAPSPPTMHEEPVDPESPGTTPPTLGTSRSVSTPYRDPGTDLEQHIARVWSQTLGVDAIGVDDNFFELGGESLLAIRTVTRLRQELGVDFPVRVLFDHLTIATLARHIESLRPRPADEATPSAAIPTTIPRRRRGRRGGFTENGETVLEQPPAPSSEPPEQPVQGMP